MPEKKLSQVKKKAWRIFSEYYRRKHADSQGYARCYTCGVRKHWKELQVGHLLDGRYNSILFDEHVVRLQCRRCNLFLGGNKEVFIPKFIDEMGRDVYDGLIRQKHQTVKYSVSDLEDMIEMWKANN